MRLASEVEDSAIAGISPGRNHPRRRPRQPGPRRDVLKCHFVDFEGRKFLFSTPRLPTQYATPANAPFRAHDGLDTPPARQATPRRPRALAQQDEAASSPARRQTKTVPDPHSTSKDACRTAHDPSPNDAQAQPERKHTRPRDKAIHPRRCKLRLRRFVHPPTQYAHPSITIRPSCAGIPSHKAHAEQLAAKPNENARILHRNSRALRHDSASTGARRECRIALC